MRDLEDAFNIYRAYTARIKGFLYGTGSSAKPLTMRL
jgi:hypothetical protein